MKTCLPGLCALGALFVLSASGCSSGSDPAPASDASTSPAADTLATVSPRRTETMGSIKTVMDGKTLVRNTLRVPSEGTATAEILKIGASGVVNLQAHDPGADRMLHNALAITFSFMGEGTRMQVLNDVEVNLYPTGLAGSSYGSERASIEWERLELRDDGGYAKGRFTASLCHKETSMSELDLGDCREMVGELDTELDLSKVDIGLH